MTALSATPDHRTPPTATLAHANEIRLARAALKRKINTGEIAAADVILRCPPEARTWPVTGVLRAQRRWGDYQAGGLLHRAGVSEYLTVGELTARQRAAIVAWLGREARR
ncbi:MAG: hypothetical protein ABSB73_09635 [Solirubrobacteraceae bacterium]|jgi:hypothetical protein